MKVDKKEILHIAKLANLNLKEEEIEKYIENLEDILNFAEILNKVDTSNIDEGISPSNNFNVFRKDEVQEFEDKESLLLNSQENEDNMFKIPKVIN